MPGTAEPQFQSHHELLRKAEPDLGRAEWLLGRGEQRLGREQLLGDSRGGTGPAREAQMDTVPVSQSQEGHTRAYNTARGVHPIEQEFKYHQNPSMGV